MEKHHPTIFADPTQEENLISVPSSQLEKKKHNKIILLQNLHSLFDKLFWALAPTAIFLFFSSCSSQYFIYLLPLFVFVCNLLLVDSKPIYSSAWSLSWFLPPKVRRNNIFVAVPLVLLRVLLFFFLLSPGMELHHPSENKPYWFSSVYRSILVLCTPCLWIKWLFLIWYRTFFLNMLVIFLKNIFMGSFTSRVGFIRYFLSLKFASRGFDINRSRESSIFNFCLL